MKTHKNILIAFLLNMSFAILEFIGGIFTNSVAIISDSIHDFGDALSIGISYILEKISKRKPNKKYTYGYVRYSVIGSFITTTILIIGSIFVVYNAILRIFNPVEINYNGMLIFAVFGVIMNFLAAYITKDGESLNQKAVNLHMLEDVLGWIVVLIGSILIRITNINIIDSIMSIGVAIFIFINAFKNLISVVDIFLEKTPNNINLEHIRKHILEIHDVEDIHHLHVWSIDGITNYATMHVITESKDCNKIKHDIKEELLEHGIVHATIELESNKDNCKDKECNTKIKVSTHHHHH